MRRSTLLFVAALTAVVLPGRASAQARHFPLESLDGVRLHLHNVAAEPATHQGKKGLRLTLAPNAVPAGAAPADIDQLALIDGLEFSRAWTKIKIEVRGDRARLYVHDREQPTLVVNDVKSGASGTGGVALWLDAGTIAHFRNLTVRPEPARR